MKEKYEILKVTYTGTIYDRFDGTYWYDSKYAIISDVTGRIHKDSLGSCKIYSIKRISDKEVFTLGDKTSSGVIDKININDTHISFYHGVNSGPNLYLDEIKHVVKWKSKLDKEQAYMALYQGKIEIRDYLRIVNPFTTKIESNLKLLLVC